MRSVELTACVGLVLTGTVVACAADDSIQLPSGTVIRPSSFEVRPKSRAIFPEKHPFYAEKTSTGGLQGMHGRDAGKLRGGSVTLYENGTLKTLGAYPDGARDGAFRLWDENRKMIVYSTYKDGKKHGVTCLLRDDSPWLVQECKNGKTESEFVLTPEGKATEDAQEIARARQALADAEATLKEAEQETRQNLHEWYAEMDQRIKEQNVKLLKPVKELERERSQQRGREEMASAISAAKPKSRTGRAAGTIAGAAKADRKAAAKAAKGAAAKAKKAIQTRNAAIREESHEMWEFAIAALEKSVRRSSEG